MTFPDISPFVFGLEYNGFGIRWYALAYIVGLLLAWRLAMRLADGLDLSCFTTGITTHKTRWRS